MKLWDGGNPHTYDRIEPDGPCISPDGHECVEIRSLRSPIPEAARCPRCGKAWTIVTFDQTD